MQGKRPTAKRAPKAATPTVSTLDLDALLAKRLLTPAPVTLGGHTYQVRTDLTPAEATEYLRLAAARRDVEAFTLLVGEDGQRLNDALDALPVQHLGLAVRAIMRASVVLAGNIPGEYAHEAGEGREDGAGESLAS